MKKLLTAFAACMMAGWVSAQVESQNIVGYQTSTINPTGSLTINGGKLNMLGLNWQTVGGGAYPIQSFFGGDAVAAGLTANGSFGAADQLQVWTGTGYTTYFLSANASYPTLNNVWIKFGEFVATTDTLTPGTGFWLLSRAAGNNGSLTQAGQVNTNVTSAITLNGTGIGFGGLTMIANPYPADIALNGSFDWAAAGATKNGSFGAADQLQVWTGAGYTTYYLSANATYPSLDNKWIKFGEFAATEDAFKAGAGAWYKTVHTANWTLNLPRPY